MDIQESLRSASAGYCSSNGCGRGEFALSPGLQVSMPDRRGWAYELKFRVSEAQARAIEAWAAALLPVDPHVEPGLGNAYRVTSLYFDTPRLDVFHRVPPYHRRKLRLRGYGASATFFLEQKTRRGDRVRKRRTEIAEADLTRLQMPLTRPQLAASPRGGAEEWAGDWFRRRLAARELTPSYQVWCVRSAFGKDGSDGPMRLTLDRQLQGIPNPQPRLLSWQGGLPLLPGEVVLELKYRNALPHLFKHLLDEMVLSPCPVSKYRLAVRAWDSQGAIQRVG